MKLLEEGSTQRAFVPTLALLEEFDPDAVKARELLRCLSVQSFVPRTVATFRVEEGVVN